MNEKTLEQVGLVRRSCLFFNGALLQLLDEYPDDQNVRRAVAKRGRDIQVEMEKLCVLLETEGDEK